MRKLKEYSIDKKTHGKIINALRKLTFSYHVRNEVLRDAKVAPAAFQCNNCDKICYTGSKKLSDTGLKEKFKNVRAEKIYVDHIDPVIPVNGFKNKKWDWHQYVLRMFCGRDGLQTLCSTCHDKKTKKENELRRKKK